MNWMRNKYDKVTGLAFFFVVPLENYQLNLDRLNIVLHQQMLHYWMVLNFYWPYLPSHHLPKPLLANKHPILTNIAAAGAGMQMEQIQKLQQETAGEAKMQSIS